MSKGKSTKGQLLIYKRLRIKLNVEQHEPTFNPGGELWCSGRVLVPAPLVAPVVLI
jgi:hypothetical protein